MATIRKRGDRYQVQVRRTGFPPTVRTFQRLTDARQWARTIELKVDRRELPGDLKLLDAVTLAQLVERYRDTVVPNLRGADRETVILDAFLRHPICRKPLSQLNTADFAEYRDERLKVIQPATLRRQLTPIARMFRVAHDEWGLPIPTSPLAKLRFTATDTRRERRLGAGEYEKLLDAGIDTRNPLIVPIVRFALETAMRRGEILPLRWAQVDLPRRTVTVLEAKNGYSRVIPITEVALAVLSSVKPDKVRSDAVVFEVSENAFKLAWQRLVKRANLIDLHFHDLRHEAISRLFELGLTAPEVASISGHRTLSQLSRYAHASNHSIRLKLRITQPALEGQQSSQ